MADVQLVQKCEMRCFTALNMTTEFVNPSFLVGELLNLTRNRKMFRCAQHDKLFHPEPLLQLRSVLAVRSTMELTSSRTERASLAEQLGSPYEMMA
jgi:hypothetical protein